jgi:hypothetical protein
MASSRQCVESERRHPADAAGVLPEPASSQGPTADARRHADDRKQFHHGFLT